MGLRHRHREEVSEHQLELVRDAYRFMQAWELRPVRELLASGVPGGEAAFCVIRGLFSNTCRETDDLPGELFWHSLPPHWEISSLEVRELSVHHDTIAVAGLYRCRPKGSWEVMELPFLHLWRLRDGRLLRVLSPLDAVELRRVA